MKKLLIVIPLFSLAAIVNAQSISVQNALSCNVHIKIYAHDATACGGIVCNTTVAAATTTAFLSMLDLNSTSCSGTGPGWIEVSGGAAHCVLSLSSADLDGVFVTVIGGGSFPILGHSTCYSTLTASSTDCSSTAIYADWDYAGYPDIKVHIHY